MLTDGMGRVNTCTGLLPEHKPRYVMGVGYPEDLVVSVALGADMFDCVWGTRTARFGNAITSKGVLNLRNAQYSSDFSAVDPGCDCPICRPVDAPAPAMFNATNGPASYDKDPTGFAETGALGMGITKSYIHHLAAKETAGAHLLTIHNVWYLLRLMRDARKAVVEDRYPDFVRGCFEGWYAGDKSKFPGWAVDAMAMVGVDLRA